LEALFDADRASLLTGVVLRAISEFSIDTDQLHNDSTSISVHGVYSDAAGTSGRPVDAGHHLGSLQGPPPRSSSWSGSSPSAPTARSRWPIGSPTATPVMTLTLRLILAGFGVVVCALGALASAAVAGRSGFAVVLAVLAAVAAIDFVVVHRKRRGEPG
jgi:hypothetical protein